MNVGCGISLLVWQCGVAMPSKQPFLPKPPAGLAVCSPRAGCPPWAYVSHPRQVRSCLGGVLSTGPQAQLSLGSSRLSRPRLLSWRIWLEEFHLWILLRKDMSKSLWELIRGAGNPGSMSCEVFLMIRNVCTQQPSFLSGAAMERDQGRCLFPRRLYCTL